MYAYLVRHGEATSREEDPERPLSAQGMRDVKKVAHTVEREGVRVTHIYHSDKTRTRQTAEIFADVVKPSSGVSRKDGLNPNDDPVIWADRLKTMNDDIMLIGHLPHIEKLASLLSGKSGLSFKAGQIWCLERDSGGKWVTIWTVGPYDEI